MKESVKRVVFLCLLVSVIGYCGKEKPLSPTGVLDRTKKAYENKNGKLFLQGLSQKILTRMEDNLSAIRMTFSRLSETSRKGIAEKMNVSPSSLSKITLEEYTEYQIKTEQMGMGSDSTLFPVKYLDLNAISNLSIQEDIAIITFPESRVLKMKKEKTGWKIDSIQISPEKSDDAGNLETAEDSGIQ